MAESNEKRTRSRNGCLTCRKRKKRCDEHRPFCETCTRLQLECVYPTPGNERKNKRRKHDDDMIVKRADRSIQPQQQIPSPKEDEIETVAGTTTPGSTSTDGLTGVVDILSPMFRLDDVLANDSLFTAVPDFSLPGALLMDETISTTDTMLATLKGNFQHLDDRTMNLFEYFCDTQGQLMSVSPQNQFKNIFAKMAVSNEPVLYALLSWAAFHYSQADKMEGGDSLGHSFLNKAVALISDPNKYSFTVMLASLVLIASANICAGDLLNWRSYMEIAAELIKKQGLTGFDWNDEQVYWLLKNFTYHDILAFGNRKRTLLLPKEIHDQILNYKCDVLPDSLCASCHPVFVILASINDIYREMHENTVTFSTVNDRANELLREVDHAVPDRELLLPLSYMDARDQINLFRVFQQLARLTISNLLLRMNAACVPMQVMNDQMLSTLSDVVNTKGEAALVFPHFCAGITASRPESREQVIQWLDIMHERHSSRNIQRAKTLLREVWARDEQGTKYVDWNHVAEIKGWNLSFA